MDELPMVLLAYGTVIAFIYVSVVIIRDLWKLFKRNGSTSNQ